jgi:phosphotransferase system  glucose/maltose/N-acetylglucosamine-specific IIC component
VAKSKHQLESEAEDRFIGITVTIICLPLMVVIVILLNRWKWLDTDIGAVVSMITALGGSAIIYGVLIYSLVTSGYIAGGAALFCFLLMNYMSLYYLLLGLDDPS